jgi:hypothetical protein
MTAIDRAFPLYEPAAFGPFYETDSKHGVQQTDAGAGAIGAGKIAHEDGDRLYPISATDIPIPLTWRKFSHPFRRSPLWDAPSVSGGASGNIETHSEDRFENELREI